MDSFLDSYFILRMCLVHTFSCRDKNNLVWIFDQSSGHNCYSDDALVAKRMSIHPGGKQPRMHPGRLPNGAPQMMVDRCTQGFETSVRIARCRHQGHAQRTISS